MVGGGDRAMTIKTEQFNIPACLAAVGVIIEDGGM